MSLNENERSIFEASMGEFSPVELLHIREAALAEAQHIGFHEIEGIFDEPLRLEFESGHEIVLTIWPWTNESKPSPNVPVLGHIDAWYGLPTDKIPTQPGIIIDGVTLEGVMRVEDRGSIAKMCELAYRPCISKKVTYIGLSKDGEIEEFNRIEALRAVGMVRRSGDVDYELVPSSVVRYLPSVLQVYAGVENRPLFDN